MCVFGRLDEAKSPERGSLGHGRSPQAVRARSESLVKCVDLLQAFGLLWPERAHEVARAHRAQRRLFGDARRLGAASRARHGNRTRDSNVDRARYE